VFGSDWDDLIEESENRELAKKYKALKNSGISIAILPFGFLIEAGEMPVVACNNLSEDEAVQLALLLASAGKILEKGNVTVFIEESLSDKMENIVGFHGELK
jgi:hypothetical protein